jgi:hypothetical protein
MSKIIQFGDHISDRVIDMLNEEMKKQDFSPVGAILGVMMAFHGFVGTAPFELPATLCVVMDAMNACIMSILDEQEQTDG